MPTNYTYNALIKRLEEFATLHPSIQKFSQGQLDDQDVPKDNEYPYLHIELDSILYNEGEQTFNINGYIFDIAREKENATDYPKEIISDCSRIAGDLIATINNSTMFGDSAMLELPVRIQPEIEERSNNLSGVTFQLSITFDFRNNFCDIPNLAPLYNY